MSDAKHRWADEVKDSLDAVKTIRDELKVQMRLGSMDAKARFAELERRLDNEQLNVRKNLGELVASFRLLKEELGKPGGKPTKHP